jgi:prefoldin subunit 5
MLNIGADVYLEMKFEEALPMLEKRAGIITRKLELLQQQIIKNKTYVKLTLSLIEQIKNS